MEKDIIKDRIKYWLETANHDYETMNILFKTKRYSDCLFYGHIVLEKALKGLVVKETKKEAPFIHNLTKLAELANGGLLKDEMDLLDKVNDFNIRARYPEYKIQFYKQCDREYAGKYIDKISSLYKKLCQKLTQKK